MPTAEAHVRAEHPSRYLVQLCRHAEGMMRHAGTFAHRGRPGRADGHSAGPELLHVECSAGYGVLRLNVGECTLQTGADTLIVRAEAPDEEKLQRIQDIVSADLERFGQRHGLKVTWQ